MQARLTTNWLTEMWQSDSGCAVSVRNTLDLLDLRKRKTVKQLKFLNIDSRLK